MFKLTIQGDGLNFDMEISQEIAVNVIRGAMDNKFDKKQPVTRPTVVQATPTAEPIQIAEPESEPEPEDGEPP